MAPTLLFFLLGLSLLLSSTSIAAFFFSPFPSKRTVNGSPLILANAYDDWRSDIAVVDTMHLSEENVQQCLQLFVESEYGQEMFGCWPRPASVGITGDIELVEVSGPQVVLSMSGNFWHKRSTVLGRAAVWLNACMPEITDVTVNDVEILQDFREVVDEESGEVLYTEDKRSPDFNGDRATMEYQGLDPDVRGPFPQKGMDINPI